MPNPNEKDWEISLESVVLVKVIGKGAFGQVAKGMVKGFDKDSGNRLVAIKMLRGKAKWLYCYKYAFSRFWKPS